MISWTNTPPSTTSDCGYRLIRTPPFKPLRGIILADDLLGTPTHYTKGRTLPCPQGECEHCANGLPYRWHAYVPILCMPGKERVILEMTALAADQLKGYHSRFGTLRGLEVYADRPSRKPNGRIVILAKASGIPDTELPVAPDIRRILLHIWGIDDAAIEDNGRRRNMPASRFKNNDVGNVVLNPSAEL